MAFDLPTANRLFEQYGTTDFTPFLRDLADHHHQAATANVHLIMAGKNNTAWTPEAVGVLEDVKGSGAPLHTYTLRNAGHWVHVDDLKGLVDIMEPTFAK